MITRAIIVPVLAAGFGVSTIVLATLSWSYSNTIEELEESLKLTKNELTLCNFSNTIRDNRLLELTKRVEGLQSSIDSIDLEKGKDTITIIERQPAPTTCDEIVDFLNDNLPEVKFIDE